METQELANLIFPNAKEIAYYEEKYKTRDLKERSNRYTLCTKSNGVYAYRRFISGFDC